MIYKTRKIFYLAIALFFVSTLLPMHTRADCRYYNRQFECGSPKPDDICTNSGTGSTGTAHYAFASYEDCDNGPGFYRHDYDCTSPCNSPDTNPGDGGGSGAPSCDGDGPAGTILMCESPAIVDCVTNAQNCHSQFPSVFTGWEVGDNPPSCNQAYPPQTGKQFCQINCGCCLPDEVFINGVCTSRLPICVIEAPQTITTSNITSNSADVSWVNGDGQQTLVRIGSNVNEVMIGCPNYTTPYCDVAVSIPNYTKIASPFSARNMYYYNTSTNQCTQTSAQYTSYASCESNLDTYLGNTSTGICYHDISSCQQYSTGSYALTSLLPSTEYFIRVVSYNDVSCTAGTFRRFTTLSDAALPNTIPWWQVKDGDVTANGNLSSNVPDGSLFSIIPGSWGFPGVPVYENVFNLYPTYPSRVSDTIWNANAATIQSRIFNYSYFKNIVPSDVNDLATVATDSSLRSTGYTQYGYEWFKVTSNLSINSDINLGSRKVVLFVENGNLTINGRVNLNDGQGFFGAFVEGDILIDSSVTGTPSIEGLYLSDGNFSTGAGSSELHVRGSVASYGGITLERDLPDNVTAAELFEFAPDQLFLFPEKLANRRTRWAEIEP